MGSRASIIDNYVNDWKDGRRAQAKTRSAHPYQNHFRHVSLLQQNADSLREKIAAFYFQVRAISICEMNIIVRISLECTECQLNRLLWALGAECQNHCLLPRGRGELDCQPAALALLRVDRFQQWLAIML